MKNAIIIVLFICLAVSGAACSRSGQSKPDSSNVLSESNQTECVSSSTSEAINDLSSNASSTPDSSKPLQETPSDWSSEWPVKYKVYDRYVVAQPKNSTIKVYLYNNEKQEYTVIEQPIPDYMITLYDCLNPIIEKYDKLQIERIVYDDAQQKICANFHQDYITAYANDEAANKEILYSIAKTIIENYNLELNGVYFEVDMKPFMEPDMS